MLLIVAEGEGVGGGVDDGTQVCKVVRGWAVLCMRFWGCVGVFLYELSQ